MLAISSDETAARISSGVGTSRCTQKVDTARSRAKDPSLPSFRSRPISAGINRPLPVQLVQEDYVFDRGPRELSVVQRERQVVERVTQERGLLKAQTQVSDDKEIFVGSSAIALARGSDRSLW
jgi:hypothetical protein